MSASGAHRPSGGPPDPATSAGSGTLGVTWAILRKDLTVELRTMETIPAMVIFTVATFVIFHFGLQLESSIYSPRVLDQIAAGVLAVSLLFAAVLGTNRLFVAEREQGGFDGFLLAPVNRTAMLYAKATALFIYMVVLEIFAVAAFAVFIDPPGFNGSAFSGLILFLLLVDVAFALTGTLVSALAVNTRARDLIGPIIGLPLQIPALISFSIGASRLIAPHPHLSGEWLLILALYDVFNALLAYAVFDFLLEE